MKKILYVFLLMAAMLILVTGCTTGNLIQISTPVPGAPSGTPAANGQINVPAVNIQLNAPGPNPLMNKVDSHNKVAGLPLGIWHGVISPVTLILSFFYQNVQMYEVHNNGNMYNLGFFLGIMILYIILGLLFGRRR